jgi:hypothetical protein
LIVVILHNYFFVGYESERKKGDVEKYNQIILHETIRVAVCGMMENPTCGDLFEVGSFYTFERSIIDVEYHRILWTIGSYPNSMNT